MGCESKRPASSGQQSLSGTVSLLPVITYDKQLDRLKYDCVQSSPDGVGAGACARTPPCSMAHATTTTVAASRGIRRTVDVAMASPEPESGCCGQKPEVQGEAWFVLHVYK